MDKGWLLTIALVMAMVFCTDAMGQQKKTKSTKKLTKQYVDYVKNKDKGKEQLAQKKSSDPATVTRDSASQQKPQTTFEDVFNEFRQQAKTEYENFRDQANREYAEFVRKVWEEYKVMPAIPKPKEEEVPPVVIPEEEEDKPIEDKPLPIKDEVVPPPPAPRPQPIPVAPIKEQPKPVEKYVSFNEYGTTFKVRFNDEQRFSLKSCSSVAIADAWELLSGPDYNNTIRDCLEIRINRQLSDWAYLMVLHKMAVSIFGKTNEATLLMAFIYCQSGYQMRMGISDNRLYLLYASEHGIFDKAYFKIDGKKFYMFMADVKSMNICNVGFPQEKPMSLLINKEQLFDYAKSPLRTLKSRDYPDVNVTLQSCVNKNALAFYNDYPTSMLDDNVVSRWAMYANMPLPERIKKELLPALQSKIKGLCQLDAMQKLLNFVQTAFVYEYDDKVWGGDRAFFPEETLYYPYCDCEDRAIFLSRIVRDLLGLKCILIYYPGHLAMAVCFTENVKGDYIMLNGKKFVVCDPTCMGASVGMTAPGLDNQTAKVILLE